MANYLGRNNITADRVNATAVTAGALRVGDGANPYAFPTQRGADGDILVQQTNGSLAFQPNDGSGVSDHFLLSNIGTNTHAQLDAFKTTQEAFKSDTESKLGQAVNPYSDVVFKDCTLNSALNGNNYLRFSEGGDMKFELEHEGAANQMIWRDQNSQEFMRMTQGGLTSFYGDAAFNELVYANKNNADAQIGLTNNFDFKWNLTNRGSDVDQFELRDGSNTPAMTLYQGGEAEFQNRVSIPAGVETPRIVNSLEGFVTMDTGEVAPGGGNNYLHLHSGSEANPGGYNIRCAKGSTRIRHGFDATLTDIEVQQLQITSRVDNIPLSTATVAGTIFHKPVTFNDTSNSFTLPSDRGVSGQVLTSDGNGGVSWQPPVAGLWSQTGTVSVSNSAAELIFNAAGQGSRVLPAVQTGSTFHVKCGGLIKTDGNGNAINFRLKLGPTVIAESGAVGLPSITTVKFWEVEFDFVVRVPGATGTIQSQTQFTYEDQNTYEGAGASNTVSPVDTSGLVQLTAQWNQALPGNSVSNSIMYITQVY